MSRSLSLLFQTSKLPNLVQNRNQRGFGRKTLSDLPRKILPSCFRDSLDLCLALIFAAEQKFDTSSFQRKLCGAANLRFAIGLFVFETYHGDSPVEHPRNFPRIGLQS